MEINSPGKAIFAQPSVPLLWLVLGLQQVKRHRRRRAVADIFVVVDGSCLPIPHLDLSFQMIKVQVNISTQVDLDMEIGIASISCPTPQKKKRHK